MSVAITSNSNQAGPVMKLLTFTTLFPNNVNPIHPPFVKQRMLEYSNETGNPVTVVAPVPYFPPIKQFSRWYRFSQVRHRELQSGLTVYHPRFILVPKIGMIVYGLSMFLGVLCCVRRLRRNFFFDAIDGHYLFPDGLAAVLLGKWFGVPVVLSGRGTDVNLYLSFPWIRRQIVYAAKQASHVIAVSHALKHQMVMHGIPPGKIRVIPNGVDDERFGFIPLDKSRNHLNISTSDRMILSVGSLTDNKGHHIVIQALALLKEQSTGKQPLIQLQIIGSGDREASLKQLVENLDLQDCVMFRGSIDNRLLPYWYTAADLFCLASETEGHPNVICEALACGTPVVATQAGSILDMVKPGKNGTIVRRTPQDFAQAISSGLSMTWDRERISDQGRKRNWKHVARELDSIFQEAIERSDH